MKTAKIAKKAKQVKKEIPEVSTKKALKINPDIEIFARIKVIGVGGSGSNAINHMISQKVKNVDFIVMNTDTQDLHKSLAHTKIHLGKNLTKGLGAGMNPEIGRQSAEETKAEIQDVIKGSDMVFLACGMGGGTGTGAAPVIARAAREQGILTVAVVTKPFIFEGSHRARLAQEGLDELKKEVDAIIVVPNDKLMALAGANTGIKDAFAMCDDVLRQAVEGISELITTTGMINVDFADIKTIMQGAGSALMGIGIASGENRAEQAALMAINSPLLDLSIAGAHGVLFAISGGDDLTLFEVGAAANLITESVDKDAKIVFGTIKDDTLKKGEIKITVIATGFQNNGVNKNLFSANHTDVSITPHFERNTADVSVHTERTEYSKEDTGVRRVVISDTVQEAEIVLPEDLDEDEEEWGAVPAFLRRKK